ncbi:fructosamine kinase family protein [Neosynechococcus sphagnicola]|uniref:fructosamine kinase family protein n=1 Tax=Neosynechococcus sphagnicola TaxID=1501145 RepID=UPI000B14FEE0
MWTSIADHISHTTGKRLGTLVPRSVAGGCINQTYQLADSHRSYFVKLNQAQQLAMFAAEARGLHQIYQQQTIRVPQPICWGVAADSSYLVLEWLDLGAGKLPAWEAMGRALAALHQIRGSDAFGWEIANTIGTTPQINLWDSNWAAFFSRHRLGYQFQLARRRGGTVPPI